MLVSIIIPCFNVEKYIDECVNSALNQSYKNIEIICVDNNSTDNTYNLILNLKDKYPNKIQLLKEHKKGAPAARNKGLSIAKGTWVQFLDADDLLNLDKIENQINIVKQNNGISIIAGTYFKKKINQQSILVELKQTDIYKALFVTNLGITSANLFHLEPINKIGAWNEDLNSSQETELMFRLIKNNANIFLDNNPSTIIREREEGQISQQNPAIKWKQYLDVRIDIISYLKINDNSYFTTEKKYYYDNLFVQLRILAKYDITLAHLYLLKYFEPEFISGKNMSNFKYKFLYLIFGFKKTEKIIQFIKLIYEKSIR